jgi:integrase
MKRHGFRLFKTSYNDRHGRKREASNWYVEFGDHLEMTRRLPAFTSKAASEELGKNLVRLIEYYRATGGQTDPALQSWLTALEPRTRRKLVAIGLIAGERVAACKPLTEHLADWTLTLQARGNSADHVALVTARVRRILDGCKFQFPADIAAGRVQTFLHELRQDKGSKPGISAQTFNFYLTAINSFCRWLVKDRRASENPVAHLDGLNVRTDRRHDRRALTTDELRQLLHTTANGPDRGGMTGPERALLYRLALETGLRQNELRSLTRRSFGLTAAKPTVTVQAAYSKRRRDDVLPLRPELAGELKAFLLLHTPEAPAFRMPVKRTMSHAFRADVDASGVPWRDDTGRVADFHALRHTFISNLARGGVHPKTAQALARHSTITLTMDRYSHTVREELTDALTCLPDLTRAPSDAVRATGTDGADCQSLRMPSIPTNGNHDSREVDESGKASTIGNLTLMIDSAEEPAADSVLADCLAHFEHPHETLVDSVGRKCEYSAIEFATTNTLETQGKTTDSPSEIERRGRDSNPRTPFGVSGFQDRCNQPLCHPSCGPEKPLNPRFPPGFSIVFRLRF